LETSEGPRRVSVSVQAIQEDGERMGALVTLRDLDSLESINTQLQVSERLAALGRITAGVRTRSEKSAELHAPVAGKFEGIAPRSARQRIRDRRFKVLDKEIDRLDAVVQALPSIFTRPMDIRLEATQLAVLLKESWRLRSRNLQKSNIQLAQLLPIDVPEVYVDRALLKQGRAESGVERRRRPCPMADRCGWS